jgi:hypothetical protein
LLKQLADSQNTQSLHVGTDLLAHCLSYSARILFIYEAYVAHCLPYSNSIIFQKQTNMHILRVTMTLVLLSIISPLSIIVPPMAASPPPDPVHCVQDTTDCTISNAYGTFPDRSTCHASQVVYPSSEEELLRAVASATALKKKMKVVTRFSHSIPKLACPGGSDGLLISTR